MAEYEYNVNGTLAKMTYTNSDCVLYSYDLLDRLISEVYYNHNHVAVAEYHYVYNANGQLAKQYVTQNGKVVRDTVTNASTGAFQYVLDFTYDESGSPFALRKYTNSSLTSYCTYYYGCNAQGDVVTLFTGNGNIYATYSYDAWGRVLAASGTMADVNPLRYRGYYYDSETGFYYLQSRYYDPIVKRFLNADSYGSTGQGFLGYDMFAYCENEPVRFADFSGMYRIAVIYDDTFTFHNALGLGGACFTFSIIQEYLFDDVAVYSYNNADEFKECWNSLSGYYDKIIVFGHGSSNAPAIWFQNTDSYLGLGSRCKDPITSLKSVSSEDMELYICYAAKTFPDQSPQSIARFFANLTGAKVQTTAGIVHFIPLIKFTATWLDDDFPWVQVLPYSMEPQNTYNPTKEALC